MNRIVFLFMILSVTLPAYPCVQQAVDTTLTWQQHYEEAQRCERRSSVGRALAHYEAALQLHPTDTIRRDISRCLFQRGYFRQSICLSQQLLYPDSLDEDLQQIARGY